MQTFDLPQDVCPDCGSSIITTADAPPMATLFHIRCNTCPYEWLEPSDAVSPPSEPLEDPLFTKEEQDNLRGHRRWHAAALCYGYNEFVKQAETLGQKVYFRAHRDSAEQNFIKLGGTVFLVRDPVILELPDQMPHVNFSEADIELMREAVREFDSKKE